MLSVLLFFFVVIHMTCEDGRLNQGTNLLLKFLLVVVIFLSSYGGVNHLWISLLLPVGCCFAEISLLLNVMDCPDGVSFFPSLLCM